MHTEIAVIGAGVIGLSISYVLASKGFEVILIDKENDFGLHTSSRNTEVIHAGIYYRKNSLKSKLCLRGKKMIYDFCKKYNIKHKKCGKIFVATSNQEISYLDKILKQANSNGLNDLREISHKNINKIEPNIIGKSFLLSPSSGVFDSYSFMQTLLNLSIDNGVVFAPKCEFIDLKFSNPFLELKIKEKEKKIFSLNANLVINATGNAAIGISNNLFPNYSHPTPFPVKGSYLKYIGKEIIQHIIYPALIPGKILPRVDATPDINGNIRFGPSVDTASSFEDYTLPKDLVERFYPEIIKYIPKIEKNKLILDQSGIRPKIKKNKILYDDFLFDWPSKENNWLNLLGIDSPGLPASLAIGEHVYQILINKGFKK